MYLLILGHINYNRIEFVSVGGDAAAKKEIYEKKTTYLYKLISNILYDDTYDIDDTFDTNSNTKGIVGVKITNAGKDYTSVPTVNIISVGGVGTGATAKADLKDKTIDKIDIEVAGTGYTTIPTVEITGGGGSGAVAIALNSLLIGDGKYEKYKHLTYIYNYLESRYVNISANNNKNYLANIIKGINNKLNDDDKIMNTESKSARYMFSDDINRMKTPKDYDNEDEILNVANNVSTSSLAATYVFNIILIVFYFNVISANIK